MMFLSFKICIIGSVLIIGRPHNARALESFLLMANCFSVLEFASVQENFMLTCLYHKI